MSNRKRLLAVRERIRCGACNGSAGGRATVLPDGQHICPRCVDTRVLAQRLPCGHVGIPGTMVISDSADRGNFQCIQCSAESTLPGRAN